jgi:hypothetical protein
MCVRVHTIVQVIVVANNHLILAIHTILSTTQILTVHTWLCAADRNT